MLRLPAGVFSVKEAAKAKLGGCEKGGCGEVIGWFEVISTFI